MARSVARVNLASLLRARGAGLSREGRIVDAAEAASCWWSAAPSGGAALCGERSGELSLRWEPARHRTMAGDLYEHDCAEPGRHDVRGCLVAVRLSDLVVLFDSGLGTIAPLKRTEAGDAGKGIVDWFGASGDPFFEPDRIERAPRRRDGGDIRGMIGDVVSVLGTSGDARAWRGSVRIHCGRPSSPWAPSRAATWDAWSAPGVDGSRERLELGIRDARLVDAIVAKAGPEATRWVKVARWTNRRMSYEEAGTSFEATTAVGPRGAVHSAAAARAARERAAARVALVAARLGVDAGEG